VRCGVSFRLQRRWVFGGGEWGRVGNAGENRMFEMIRMRMESFPVQQPNSVVVVMAMSPCVDQPG
jgi:hypothetical protein